MRAANPLNESCPAMVPPSIHPALAQALSERGYDTLTEVQLAVADAAVADRDLLVSSKTGSGKTVAYGLGLGRDLLGDMMPGDMEASKLPQADLPLALIVAPTRELALQVERELEWLYAGVGAKIVSCVGGMDARRERRLLDAGVHIVVGTPGRLRDHLERRALDLSELAAIVLDEADEMLDLGFREDLEFILDKTPPERRTLLFSATLPKAIVTLATRFQKNAHRIEVAGGERGHADIAYRAIMVTPTAVEHAVVNLLRQADASAALVFCNTREAVRHLHATLTERGFSVVFLSGELGQHERNQALQALRDGRAKVCIATDVAARGIDLPNLGLVIHADLPNDAEVMQHRSGRTGRAGRKGISALIVPPARRRKAERLLQDAGIRPSWSGAPTAEEIRVLDRERMLMDPILTDPSTEDDRAMGATLLASRPPEEIAAALARLYRLRLPEPEDIEVLSVEPGANRRARPDRADRDKGPATPGRWFRVSIGRQDRAEPKGLIRLLARRGDIDKRDIGAIRIFDNTTEVEIAASAADTFAAHAPSAHKEDVQIEPLDMPAAKWPQRPKFERPQRTQEEGSFERPARAKREEERPRDVHPPREEARRDEPRREPPRKDEAKAGKPWPKDSQPKDSQPRESQPRESQPRESRPNESRPYQAPPGKPPQDAREPHRGPKPPAKMPSREAFKPRGMKPGFDPTKPNQRAPKGEDWKSRLEVKEWPRAKPAFAEKPPHKDDRPGKTRPPARTAEGESPRDRRIAERNTDSGFIKRKRPKN